MDQSTKKTKQRFFKYVGPNAETIKKLTGDASLRFKQKDGYYVAQDEAVLIKVSDQTINNFESISANDNETAKTIITG